MKDKEINNYISLQEATKYCSYSQEYLSLRARQGKLKAVKLGRNWFTKKEWIENYGSQVEDYKNNLNGKAKKVVVRKAVEVEPPANLPVGDFELIPVKSKTVELVKSFSSRKTVRYSFVFSLIALTIIFSAFIFKSPIQSFSNAAGLNGTVETFKEYGEWMGQEINKVPVINKLVQSFVKDNDVNARQRNKTIRLFVSVSRETYSYLSKTFNTIAYIFETAARYVFEAMMSGWEEIRDSYVKAKGFIVRKTNEAKNLFAKWNNNFVKGIRFAINPWKIIPSNNLALLEEINQLKDKIEQIERGEVVYKEIIKEVSQVTNVEEVQKIIESYVQIEDKDLALINARLDAIESWQSGISFTSSVPNGPIYISAPSGLQVGGHGAFDTLGVSGPATVDTLAVRGATHLGTNPSSSSDVLIVGMNSTFQKLATFEDGVAANFGIGDTSADYALEILDTATQLTISYTDETVYTEFYVNSDGDLIINPSGGNVNINDAYYLPSADGSSNQALVTDGSGTVSWASVAGIPGGSDGLIQYNDGGSFGGASGLSWDDTTGILTVTTLNISSAMTSSIDMNGNNIFLSGGYLSGDGDNEGVYVDSSGNVGIGDSSPDYALEVLDTSTQLALTYTDDSVYALFGVDANGDLRIETSGSNVSLGGDNLITGNIQAGNINGTWTGAEIGDAYISDTITASNYLPLTGGTISGATTVNAILTVSTLQVGSEYALPSEDGSANYVLKTDGSGNLHWRPDTDTNTQLTQEQVEDYAGAMVSSNTETLITVTYQDDDGTIDFVVDNDLSHYDNGTSGFITATLTEEQVQDYAWNIAGGTQTLITVTYQDGTDDVDFVVDNDLHKYSWTNVVDADIPDAITVTGYMQDEDIDTFSELQDWVSDATLLKGGTLTDGKVCKYDSGTGTVICNYDIAGTPSGVNGQIQYNNSGSFGGASMLYYDDANDRVGIGENAPTAVLEVTTAGGSDPYFYITSSTDGDIFSVLNSGNVGIGDSSPDYKLEVLDTSTQLALTYTDDSAFTDLSVNSSGDLLIDPSGGDVYAYSNLNVLNNLAVDTNTLYVDSSANRVGIGTSNPEYKLHIYAPGQASTNNPVDVMSVEIGASTSGTDTGYGPSIIFRDPPAQTIVDLGRIAAIYENDTREITGMSFYTNSGSGLTERLRINNSGNVGIGDSSPDYKLEVLSTTTQLTLTHTDDTYLSEFYVDGSGNLNVDSIGDILLAPSGGDLLLPAGSTLGATGEGDIYFFDGDSSGENYELRVYGYITATSGPSFAALNLDDTNDEFLIDVSDGDGSTTLDAAIRLDDAGGSSVFRVRDSGGSEVFYVDSDGITKINYDTSTPGLDANGEIAVGYVASTDRLYFYSNSGVHYVDATAGFGIPDWETFDPITGEPIEVGGFVMGWVEKEREDGSMHGLWVNWETVEQDSWNSLFSELSSASILDVTSSLTDQAWSLDESGNVISVASDSTNPALSEGGLFSRFVDSVKKALSSIGLFIENGVAKIREVITDRLTTKVARVEMMEMVDSVTGEVYCTWIANGKQERVLGECDSVDLSVQSQDQVDPTPVLEDTTPIEEPISEPVLDLEGCDNGHLGLCNTQEKCETIGLYWYGERCHLGPEVIITPEPVETFGCTDSTALNYDSNATTDDGTCQYDSSGCTDSTALNYDPNAITDDGTCQYDVSGCTDPNALNYNLEATLDDDSCVYPEADPVPVLDTTTLAE